MEIFIIIVKIIKEIFDYKKEVEEGTRIKIETIIEALEDLLPAMFIKEKGLDKELSKEEIIELVEEFKRMYFHKK